MTRKGGVATCEALARQGSSLRFLQRHAGVAGRGMDPCPEPESGAVLLLGKRSAQASGIVTRKGGDINPVNGSVSAANRARKDAHSVFEAIEAFASNTAIPTDDRIHELMHMAFTADYWRERLSAMTGCTE